MDPMEIEKKSFQIISRELGNKKLMPGTEDIVKRVIHCSADFDYADNLVFSENVVPILRNAFFARMQSRNGYHDGKVRHQQVGC